MTKMSRYLNAPKIVLLLLVKTYCDGFVPPNAIVPVLAFITSRVQPNTTKLLDLQRRRKEDSTSRFSLSLHDLETLLEPFKTKVVVENVTEELSLHAFFMGQLCRLRDIDDLFVEFKTLENLFDGAEQIEDQVRTRGSFHVTPLSKTSILGMFVRRAQVEFERLQFIDVMKVWRSFELYRQPAADKFGQGNIVPEKLGRMQGDTSIASIDQISGGRISQMIGRWIDDEGADPGRPTATDVEKILEFQIDQMQKYGTRIPNELRQRLHSIISPSVADSSLSYYVNFLDGWYKGDYASCFEYLHRYYDYAMQNNDRSNYQYALLNMAIVQADFGCYSEAIAAMNEAVASARENKDMVCLNYSLSWLYQFRIMNIGETSKEVGNAILGSESSGLHYLKSIAREYGMHSIEIGTLLNEAKYAMSRGHRPLEALERTYESSHLILEYRFDMLRASQILTQSSVYARLGVTTLSTSLCNLVMDSYALDTPQEDVIWSRCRTAYIGSLAGRYDTALESLEKLQSDASRNIKCQQYLAQFIGIIKLKRALHSDDFSKAERLIATLKSTPSENSDLTNAANLLEIEFLTRQRSLSEAFSLIESLLSTADNDGVVVDVHLRIRLLTAKATVFAKAGRPQKGFSIALRAATAAYRSMNCTALWEALRAVVVVLNGTEMWDAASKLAETVIYQVTETEDAALAAEMRSAGADAFMGQAKDSQHDKQRKEGCMREALIWVDAAFQFYKALEDFSGQCEMTAKAAIILRHLGDEEGALERAKLYDEIHAIKVRL